MPQLTSLVKKKDIKKLLKFKNFFVCIKCLPKSAEENLKNQKQTK